jgi:outer membrane protein OmpU
MRKKMKHTLLATTALVALSGAAYAEVTITGSARIGIQTTEGSLASDGTARAAALTATDVNTANYLVNTYATIITGSLLQSSAALSATEIAASAGVLANIANAVSALQIAVAAESVAVTAEGSTTAAQVATDLATAEALMSAARGAAAVPVAAVADSTDAVNRVRVSFAMAGETDGGLAYGASIRADNAGGGNAGTGGSQYISGAFGKLSMGDLNGADENAAGDISGVGLSGLGDHNEVSYQAASHNIGYEYTVSGMTFGYSQDTAQKTGSNSAMGISYSGSAGAASFSVGVGQSKVGTSTQTTMSVSATTGGLTIKAISSSNDNGPTVGAVAGTVQTAGVAAANQYVAEAAQDTTPDTDTTGISLSYSMDAMSVSAFTKTVSTAGVADIDSSGFGFSYDMGGATLKAGVVDADDQQLIDFGVSFSF